MMSFAILIFVTGSVQSACTNGVQTFVDCTSFEECIDGTIRTLFCNSGFAVSEDSNGLLSCVHPNSVSGGPQGKCFQAECENNDPKYIIPNDCTTFYGCSNMKKKLKTCPTGMVHDGVSATCVPPTSLPPSHNCYKSACVDGVVHARSCTSFRACIGGAMRSVVCNVGLVHDGTANECVPASSLPAGHKCNPSPSCTNDHVKAHDCHSFDRCVNGEYNRHHCTTGLVHLGSKAECVSRSTLQCGTKCASQCTPSICVSGSVQPVDCKSFRQCHNDAWVTSTCATGLVHHDATKALCVDPSNLTCGSHCAAPCVHECHSGAMLPLDCGKFKLCVNGKWITTTCNNGLVHADVTKDECVSPYTLQCGSRCAASCPTPDCQTGHVMPIDCSSFKLCVNQKWTITNCLTGLVHKNAQSAECVAISSLQCGSRCAAPCPVFKPECQSGQVMPTDCSSFKFCVNGKWETSTCSQGLVHYNPSKAQCLPTNSLPCGMHCTPECEKPVDVDSKTDQTSHHDLIYYYTIKSISCVKYEICAGSTTSDDPEHHTCDIMDCEPGFVHPVGEQVPCLPQDLVVCSHKCGPACPGPVVCD